MPELPSVFQRDEVPSVFTPEEPLPTVFQPSKGIVNAKRESVAPPPTNIFEPAPGLPRDTERSLPEEFFVAAARGAMRVPASLLKLENILTTGSAEIPAHWKTDYYNGLKLIPKQSIDEALPQPTRDDLVGGVVNTAGELAPILLTGGAGKAVPAAIFGLEGATHTYERTQGNIPASIGAGLLDAGLGLVPVHALAGKVPGVQALLDKLGVEGTQRVLTKHALEMLSSGAAGIAQNTGDEFLARAGGATPEEFRPIQSALGWGLTHAALGGPRALGELKSEAQRQQVIKMLQDRRVISEVESKQLKNQPQLLATVVENRLKGHQVELVDEGGGKFSAVSKPDTVSWADKERLGHNEVLVQFERERRAAGLEPLAVDPSRLPPVPGEAEETLGRLTKLRDTLKSQVTPEEFTALGKPVTQRALVLSDLETQIARLAEPNVTRADLLRSEALENVAKRDKGSMEIIPEEVSSAVGKQKGQLISVTSDDMRPVQKYQFPLFESQKAGYLESPDKIAQDPKIQDRIKTIQRQTLEKLAVIQDSVKALPEDRLVMAKALDAEHTARVQKVLEKDSAPATSKARVTRALGRAKGPKTKALVALDRAYESIAKNMSEATLPELLDRLRDELKDAPQHVRDLVGGDRFSDVVAREQYLYGDNWPKTEQAVKRSIVERATASQQSKILEGLKRLDDKQRSTFVSALSRAKDVKTIDALAAKIDLARQVAERQDNMAFLKRQVNKQDKNPRREDLFKLVESLRPPAKAKGQEAPETNQGVAIKYDGKVYKGKVVNGLEETHADLFARIKDEVPDKTRFTNEFLDDKLSGFYTNKREFLTRDEAAALGRQVKKPSSIEAWKRYQELPDAKLVRQLEDKISDLRTVKDGKLTSDSDELRIREYKKRIQELEDKLSQTPEYKQWIESESLERQAKKESALTTARQKLTIDSSWDVKAPSTIKSDPDRSSEAIRASQFKAPSHSTDPDSVEGILKEGLKSGSALDTSPQRDWSDNGISIIVPHAVRGSRIEHNNYYKSSGVSAPGRVIVDLGAFTDPGGLRQRVERWAQENPNVKFEVIEPNGKVVDLSRTAQSSTVEPSKATETKPLVVRDPSTGKRSVAWRELQGALDKLPHDQLQDFTNQYRQKLRQGVIERGLYNKYFEYSKLQNANDTSRQIAGSKKLASVGIIDTGKHVAGLATDPVSFEGLAAQRSGFDIKKPLYRIFFGKMIDPMNRHFQNQADGRRFMNTALEGLGFKGDTSSQQLRASEYFLQPAAEGFTKGEAMNAYALSGDEGRATDLFELGYRKSGRVVDPKKLIDTLTPADKQFVDKIKNYMQQNPMVEKAFSEFLLHNGYEPQRSRGWWASSRKPEETLPYQDFASFTNTIQRTTDNLRDRMEDVHTPFEARDFVSHFLRVHDKLSLYAELGRNLREAQETLYSPKVEETWNKHYGAASYNQMKLYLANLYGHVGHQQSAFDKAVNYTTSAYTVSKIALNLGSAAKQFLHLNTMLADGTLSTRALFKAMSEGAFASKDVGQRMLDNNGLAYLRYHGSFFGDLTNLAEFNEKPSKLRAWRDKSLVLQREADRAVMKVAWRAAELTAKQEGLTGLAANQRASELFNIAAGRDQPTSNPLYATELEVQAKRQPLLRGTLMFMREQNRIYNVVRRRVVESVQNPTPENLGRAGKALMFGVVANALGVLAINSGRRVLYNKPTDEKDVAKDTLESVTGMYYLGAPAADIAQVFYDPGSRLTNDTKSPTASMVNDLKSMIQHISGAVAAGDSEMRSGIHRGESKQATETLRALDSAVSLVAGVGGLPWAVWFQARNLYNWTRPEYKLLAEFEQARQRAKERPDSLEALQLKRAAERLNQIHDRRRSGLLGDREAREQIADELQQVLP